MVSASRWLVGSSRSSSSGCSSSSLQSATRRRSPPESLSTGQSSGGQPQRVHGLLDLGIEVPEVLGLDLVLETGHLVRRLVRIVHGEFVVAVEDAPSWRRRPP